MYINVIQTGDCIVDQLLCLKQFGNKQMSLWDAHVSNEDIDLYMGMADLYMGMALPDLSLLPSGC